jgi:hypothetical protein
MKYAALILTSSLALANEPYTIYQMEQGETVSNVLMDKLRISPIYGRGKTLDYVLKSNGLTRRSSKSLPIGFELKIPSSLLPLKEISRPPSPFEESKATPVPQETEPPLKLNHHFLASLLGGAFYYEGSSDSSEKFSGSGLLIGGKVSHLASSDNWLLETAFKAKLHHFKSEDTNKLIPTFDFEFSPRRTMNELFKIGPGVGLKRDFYFTRDLADTGSVDYAFVPNVFVSTQYAAADLQLTFNAGMNLPAKTEDNLQLETRPFLSLGLTKFLKTGFSYGIDANYESREIDELKQRFISIDFSIGRRY